MAMVRTHGDPVVRLAFGESVVLLGDQCFDNSIHIEVSFQVVGFVEAAVCFTLGASQVNEMNPVCQTAGYAGQVVIGADTARTGAKAKHVGTNGRASSRDRVCRDV